MQTRYRAAFGALAAVLSFGLPVRAADAEPLAVDFRFSPPEWQTAICLPDDPCKSLGAGCRAVIVHLPDGATRRLDPQRGGVVEFPSR